RPAVEPALPDGRRLRLVLASAAESALLFRLPADVGEALGADRLTAQAGASRVAVVALGPLRLGRVVLPRLAVGVVPGLDRTEDGLLPTALFDAVYFDNRAGAVVVNPRRASDGGGR